MAGANNTKVPFQEPKQEAGTLLGRYVPFETLVTEHDVLTRGGDLIRTWRLDALSSSAMIDAASQPLERAAAFQRLLQQLSGGRFALWSHRVRRFRQVDEAGGAMTDEVYLTLLARSAPRRSPRFLRIPRKAARSATGGSSELLSTMREAALTVCEELLEMQPRTLGTYAVKGQQCSEMLEFLALLVNGAWGRQRVSEAVLYKVLPQAHVTFTGEKIEFRHHGRVQHAVTFGMADPSNSRPERECNLRLPQDCEFIETQSFSPPAERAPQSAGCDVRPAWLGDYHYSLVLFGNSASDAEHRAAAAAYVIGATTGLAVVRCDMGDAAWFAQWPGTWSWRARQARLASRTFAAVSLYHEPHGSEPGGDTLLAPGQEGNQGD
jgi:type IV secretion system protein VirB4